MIPGLSDKVTDSSASHTIRETRVVKWKLQAPQILQFIISRKRSWLAAEVRNGYGKEAAVSTDGAHFQRSLTVMGASIIYEITSGEWHWRIHALFRNKSICTPTSFCFLTGYLELLWAPPIKQLYYSKWQQASVFEFMLSNRYSKNKCGHLVSLATFSLIWRPLWDKRCLTCTINTSEQNRPWR